MNILERAGADISEMVICGGGAKSMFWRQMIADVYGVNVKSAECGEGPAYGAAALGQYIKMYELYSKLYPSLKDVFPVLGKVGK